MKIFLKILVGLISFVFIIYIFFNPQIKAFTRPYLQLKNIVDFSITNSYSSKNHHHHQSTVNNLGLQTSNSSNNTVNYNVSENYVLLATNIDEENKLFYFFYLPIVVESWRRLGFEPVILVISSKEDNLDDLKNVKNATRITLKYLKKLNTSLVLVKSEKKFGVMTSMISRLFVGAIDFLKDEDFIITSDSDLIPIKKSYYEINDREAVCVWNAFCCGQFKHLNRTFNMYPMGHIGMKKKHWRGVIELNSTLEINTKAVADLLRASFDQSVVKEDKQIARGDRTWYADQVILSSKIEIYVNDKSKAKISKKNYQGTRLDRIHSIIIISQSYAAIIFDKLDDNKQQILLLDDLKNIIELQANEFTNLDETTIETETNTEVVSTAITATTIQITSAQTTSQAKTQSTKNQTNTAFKLKYFSCLFEIVFSLILFTYNMSG
ncbi:unnamed protein product [Brachionus calyciflorus]|uniref:Uncharacterized protein n=1 Tax=Brachionus calyciflorus TaxID=104777 RepID=A0A813Q723_9BILA|nr:unnamed protein product [Brachionus calyciflorus]